MKKNRYSKKLTVILISAVLAAVLLSEAYGDQIIVGSAPAEPAAEVADSPAGVTEPDGSTGEAVMVSEDKPSSVDTQGTEQAPPQTSAAPKEDDPDGIAASEVKNGPGGPKAPNTENAVTLSCEDAKAGSNHAGDPVSRVQLGFSIALPAHDRGDVFCAEGSVQLRNGSWQTLGYDSALCAPCYRVLRQGKDTAGIDWAICAASARKLGDTYTADGSRASELWLKSEDCVITDSININTESELRAGIVRTALSCLGCGYSYGCSGPEKFDCSGLVNYVMSENGVSVPRSSAEICGMEGRVALEDLRPGDIVGRNGHVGIYIGGGYFVHASESNVGVVSQKLDTYNSGRSPFKYYINAVGD